MEAVIAGDNKTANQIVQQLYQLADERAAFMHSINPLWDETESRNLIYTFYQYTIDEITSLLSRNYPKDIDIYDRLLHHADTMGDYFTQGLFKYMTFQQNTSNTSSSKWE